VLLKRTDLSEKHAASSTRLIHLPWWQKSKILRNVFKFPPNYMIIQPRKQKSSSSPPCYPMRKYKNTRLPFPAPCLEPYVSMSFTNSDTVFLYRTFHLFIKFVTSHLSWQFKIISIRYPERTILRKESSSSKNAFGSGWWKEMSLILHAAGGRVTGPKLPLSRGVYMVLPDR